MESTEPGKWWSCTWHDLKVAKPAPDLWASLQNFSSDWANSYTQAATDDWTRFPSDEVEKLARNKDEITGVIANGKPPAAAKIHSPPIWACGLLGVPTSVSTDNSIIKALWGCTPKMKEQQDKNVLEVAARKVEIDAWDAQTDAQKALAASNGELAPVSITPIDHKCYGIAATGDASKLGGWTTDQSVSLGNLYWMKELTADQVESMEGGPAYDRFCDFVQPAPNLSPEASGVPVVDIFGQPDARYHHSLEYEPIEKMLVLFGGTDDINGRIDKQDVLEDMWLYKIPESAEEAHGAHWVPVHYYPTEDSSDETAYVYYECDTQEWSKSTDSNRAKKLEIRPTQRYGHATTMYTSDAKELAGLAAKRWDGCLPGVSTVSGSTSEYKERETALSIEASVTEDPVSFMFVFGGNDGTELLDDMWVFSFARNPSRIGSEANRPKDSLSARFDFVKGPYIGWTQLVTNSSKYHPQPMVHARMVYGEQATGSPVGNIYIFGGVQRPADEGEGVFEGITGWGTECAAENPENAAGPSSVCHNIKVTSHCCATVEGERRDTGGLVNSLWNLSNIFDANDWSMAYTQRAISGARPLGLMDTSFAVPAVPRATGLDRYLVVFGGTFGPTHLNTKFMGATYRRWEWTPTSAAVQIKSSTLWILDMEQLSWELPARRSSRHLPVGAYSAALATARKPNTTFMPWVHGLSHHAGVLRGGVDGKPLTYTVACGLDQYDDPHNAVWQYDFGNSSWAVVLETREAEGQKTPSRRYGLEAVLVHDRYLVLYGGMDRNDKVLTDAWRVDLDAPYTHVDDASRCTDRRELVCRRRERGRAEESVRKLIRSTPPWAEPRCFFHCLRRWARVELTPTDLALGVPEGRRAPTVLPHGNASWLMFGGQPQLTSTMTQASNVETPESGAVKSSSEQYEFGPVLSGHARDSNPHTSVPLVL